MFESIQIAPPDAILGLTEQFNNDANAEKINLSVGVYKDANGKTPVLKCVKAAEQKLLETEPTKSYKPITGDPTYGQLVQQLLFGKTHKIVTEKLAITAHTPGGTGGLRVAGDYLNRLHPGASIWLSQPTWPNHPKVFEAAGVPVKTYPYFDKANNCIDFDAMIGALKQVPAGDVVLLHGCCHNPTGADPTVAQWQQISQTIKDAGAIALVDFAYQGFAEGLEQDAAGLRALCDICDELIVCSSFSKNFGLYCERVGAVTFVCKNRDQVGAVASQVKVTIRTNYSNPPAHGAGIVATVLSDDQLRQQWVSELAEMRERINGMRDLFVQSLADAGVEGDYSFITQQNGMFSFSGLTKDQVDQLREKYSIYIVGSGRINVAGMNENNVPRLCQAIKDVISIV